MQIRKTYKAINPELLYSEIKDFALKQGVTIGDSRIETYSIPDDSSSFITKGILTFSSPGKSEEAGLQVHLVGSAKKETKLMVDSDDKLFPQDKVAALQEDLDFIFSSYEITQS